MAFPTTLSELNDGFVGMSYAIGGDSDNMLYYSIPNTKAAAFETANGESIAVYYNPNCTSDMNENTYHFVQDKMCANFIYDLNGSKGPNTVGKDVGFISVLYPTDSNVVAPYAQNRNVSSKVPYQDALGACVAQDSEYRTPNRDELASLFYNKSLIGVTQVDFFWSSTVFQTGKVWRQHFGTGRRIPALKTSNNSVRCVKR